MKIFAHSCEILSTNRLQLEKPTHSIGNKIRLRKKQKRSVPRTHTELWNIY